MTPSLSDALYITVSSGIHGHYAIITFRSPDPAFTFQCYAASDDHPILAINKALISTPYHSQIQPHPTTPTSAPADALTALTAALGLDSPTITIQYSAPANGRKR